MKGSRKNEEDGEFKLRFHAGYKGSEVPSSVIIGSREFKIEEIIWRRRGSELKSGKRHEDYKCKMEGEIVKITVYESGEWSISFDEE